MKKSICVYGINVCETLLKETPNQVRELLVCSEIINPKIKDLTVKNNVKIRMVSKYELSKMTNTYKHQNVAAVVGLFNSITIDDLIEQKNKECNPLVLVLDQIEDPGNFGSIIRSAHQFGVKTIIVLKNRQCQITPLVYKRSSGTAGLMNFCFVNNISQSIIKLHKAGWWSYSTEISENAKPINHFKYDSPTLLIIGNEGKGISRLVLKNSDNHIIIPTFGKIDSLNASVSTGIILYQIRLAQKWF